jgi:hypothetical protein
MSFAPRLDALPAPQKALWPRLKEVPGHFVLYGGTALALRLAHRPSLDFDFFSGDCFVPGRLQSAVPLLKEAEALQIEENTLTVSVMSGEPVKLSFFGGLTLRRVGQAEWTNDHVVRVASLLDIAACKMAVLPQRAQAKDYLDVYHLIKNGVELSMMLGAVRAVYGEFNPIITLKALSYFGDGDLPGLPKEVQNTLRSAAAAVREIPAIQPLAGSLASDGATQ